MVSRETLNAQEFLFQFSHSTCFQTLLNQFASNKSHSANIPTALQCLFLAGLFSYNKKSVVLVVENNGSGLLWFEFFSLIFPDSVVIFPTEVKSIGFYYSVFDRLRDRAETNLSNDKAKVIIATKEALGHDVNIPELEDRLVLTLKVAFDREQLICFLESAGFEKKTTVFRPNTYATRGAVVDLFPLSFNTPVRIEFDFDKISAIREFSTSTQRSSCALKSVTLISKKEQSRAPLRKLLPKGASAYFSKPNIIKDFRLALGDAGFSNSKRFPTRNIPVKKPAPMSRVYYFSEKHKFTPKNFIEKRDILVQMFVPFSGDFVFQEERFVFDFTDSPISGHQNPLLHPATPQSKEHGLNIGDFVVHEDFGIGEFLGLDSLRFQGRVVERLAIKYNNNDKVFVSVEKFHKVKKYETPKTEKPVLASLSSNRWTQTKIRVRRALREYVEDYVLLYAKRTKQIGTSHNPRNNMLKMVENDFPFEETTDQKQSILDVYNEMAKPYPMDMLIAGDVGFGKTEVALRASVLAVNSARQTVILCPTTVLAEQHLLTFRKRLKNYPIKIASFTRLQTKKESISLLKNIANGKIDILIGTSRILSNNVAFLDLGLIVVDEEHRFGVSAKERLKKKFPSADVLSMSATPIPRSLYLSLSGLRTFSRLETPPKERVSILSEISKYDIKKIVSFFEHEILREGQIFYIHNRVETIQKTASQLKQLLPKVRFGVIHGKMPIREIDRVFLRFLNHNIDCLISTMIVESGLDIPNANTLIVERADKLGLAQLYQIRGRVGRSNRQAYALFLVPPEENLSGKARKRLLALQSFSGLGSGFALARHDLEIRGAGDLFGERQSGNIAEIGFALYSKLLNQTVSNVFGKNRSVTHEIVLPEIKYDLNIVLPESFVEDNSSRIDFYQSIGDISNIKDLNLFKQSVLDQFGKNLPIEVSRLFLIKEVSLAAYDAYVERIVFSNQEIKVVINQLRLKKASSQLAFLSEKLISEYTNVVRFSRKDHSQFFIHAPAKNRLIWTVRFLKNITV